ncbi:MAG: type II secretion system protein GspK [Gemmatimonadaceae bacterium]
MIRSRRGVALVLVLWIVVILGAVAAGLARDTQGAVGVAANARARVVARYAAESGIEATVAAIEDSLGVLADTVARQRFLNGLELEQPAGDTVPLGDARFAVSITDASARLDVNAATEEQLARFFSRFTDLGRAAMTARGIRGWIERRDGPATNTLVMLDSLGATRVIRPLNSLETLRSLQLVDESILAQAAPFLTVDGDGVINDVTAPAPVREVAGGEIHHEPSRLVLASRGWESGHPYTHEIQGVYAISGNRLVLVHWRERAL